MLWLFLAHVAATLVMVGVIWFVQIVHYPLFSQVSEAAFNLYEAQHTRLTTYVVAPAMLKPASPLSRLRRFGSAICVWTRGFIRVVRLAFR